MVHQISGGRPPTLNYGLIPGLVAERRSSAFRCSHCGLLMPAGAHRVYVPDGTRIGDDPKAISDAAIAPNRMESAWCIVCARKLGGSSPVQRMVAGHEPFEFVIAAILAGLMSASFFAGVFFERLQ